MNLYQPVTTPYGQGIIGADCHCGDCRGDYLEGVGDIMSDELKPCPFCGGTDIENEIDGVWVFTNCTDCGGSSFPVDLTKDASNQLRSKAGRDTWNTRPIEDALRAELDAARERIAELENTQTVILGMVDKGGNVI